MQSGGNRAGCVRSDQVAGLVSFADVCGVEGCGRCSTLTLRYNTRMAGGCRYAEVLCATGQPVGKVPRSSTR